MKAESPLSYFQISCLNTDLNWRSKLQDRGDDEVQNEQQRHDPDHRVHFLGLALAGLDQAVGDEAAGDAVGDGVAERHEHGGEERRNGFGDVAPLDFLQGGSHHAADHDQHACGRGGRHGGDDRGEEGGQREADRHDHGGQAGAAAGGDTRGGLHVGGGVRGAADGADGGGDGVGEQGLVHLGGEAVAVLQSLLILGGEDAGAAAGADESAQGVERIGHGEGEDGHDDQRQLGRIREQCREALGGEDRAEGLRQLGEGLADGLRVGPGGHAERDADYGGDGDGQQHAALNLHHGEHNGQYEADQEDPQHLVVEVGQTRGSRNGTALGGGLRIAGSELDQADVQHAHVGHEQADAAADGVLQGLRDGQDDHLADLGDGDEDVDQAAQEHHAHGLLPAEAEAEAHGVGEERVEAHAGGLRVRNVGEQAHHERADDGRDDGGEEHAAPRHTGRRQDLRVDDDDVRHCEERGQTGHDLSGHGGAVLFKMEELFHISLSLLGW